jgi:pilus assembly protein Flp/PilA
MNLLKNRLTSNTEGASLVEYGVLAGLIAVVAIGSVSYLGTQVRDIFEVSSNAIAPLGGSAPQVDAGGDTPVAEKPILSSIRFVAGDRGSWAQEYGWSTSAIDVNAGSLISKTNERYEIVTIYTQSFNGDMRLYLKGDVSGDDFTGISLSCDGGAREYDLAQADNFTKDYRPGNDATFWLWANPERAFVVGQESSCVIR